MATERPHKSSKSSRAGSAIPNQSRGEPVAISSQSREVAVRKFYLLAALTAILAAAVVWGLFLDTSIRSDPFSKSPGLWSWLAYRRPDAALQAMPVVPIGARGKLTFRPEDTSWVNSAYLPKSISELPPVKSDCCGDVNGTTAEVLNSTQSASDLTAQTNSKSVQSGSSRVAKPADATDENLLILDAQCLADGKRCWIGGEFGIRGISSSNAQAFGANGGIARPVQALFISSIGDGGSFIDFEGVEGQLVFERERLTATAASDSFFSKPFGAFDASGGSLWPFFEPDAPTGAHVEATRSRDPFPGQRAAVSFSSDFGQLITATDGAVQRSKRTEQNSSGSGESTWSEVGIADIDGAGNLNAMSHSRSRGLDWVVGDSGSIFWHGRAPGILTNVEPAVAYGDGSVVQRVPSGTAANLRSIYFQNTEIGWVSSGWFGDSDDASKRPVILQTLDGGKSWQRLSYAGVAAPWVFGAIPFFLLSLFGAYFAKRAIPGEPTKGITGAARPDRPIGWDDPDVIGLKPLANAIIRFLRNTGTEPPLTIAIEGKWGTGKSSLMNLVDQRLKSGGHRPVWFNAWHHQDGEQLFAALFENIRKQAIPPAWMWSGLKFRAKLLWIRAGRNLAGLGALVFSLLFAWYVLHDWLPDIYKTVWPNLVEFWDWVTNPASNSLYQQVLALAASLGTVGIAIKAVLQLLSPLKALNANPAALLADVSAKARLSDYSSKLSFQYRFAADFSDACKALKSRTGAGVVIFIDDLDRCGEKQVMVVLEAVNFLASAGECFIILGIDRDRVRERVNIAAGEPKDSSYANRYLEKLFNMAINVPAANEVTSLELATGERPALVDEQKSAWPDRIRKVLRFAPEVAPLPVLVSLMTFLLWSFAGPAPDPADTNPVVVTEADRSVVIALGRRAASMEDSVTPSIAPRPRVVPDGPSAPVADAVSLISKPAIIDWIIPLIFAFILLLVALSRRIIDVEDLVEDSNNFLDAMKIWHPAVFAKDPTPRSIKRHQNKLRFQAMRLRPDAPKDGWLNKKFGSKEPAGAEGMAQMPDELLVALGSIETVAGVLPKTGIPADVRLKPAIRTFAKRFPHCWPPKRIDITSYKGMAAGAD